jgi:pyrroline-5-carboxylate reductase
MNHIKTLGFVGFGNLAKAIWAGCEPFILEQNISVLCYKPNPKNLPKNISSVSLEQLLNDSDIIILALKPQQIELIINPLSKTDFTNKCLVSLLAGTPSAYFQERISSLTHFSRVMPNTCASIGQSMTLISPLTNTNPVYKTFITNLFNTSGKTLVIPESQMNFCTALAGSGPAFLYELAHHLIQLAEFEGLTKKDAETIVFQLFKGSAAMMTTSPLPDLIQAISSPNGTTVAGLNTFRQLTIGSQFQEVIQTAKKRAEELSKEKLKS